MTRASSSWSAASKLAFTADNATFSTPVMHPFTRDYEDPTTMGEVIHAVDQAEGALRLEHQPLVASSPSSFTRVDSVQPAARSTSAA